MEDNKTFLARLILEGFMQMEIDYIAVAPDFTSVQIDGVADLTKVAEYLLERGIQIVG